VELENRQSSYIRKESNQLIVLTAYSTASNIASLNPSVGISKKG
jgi:hypothetical protein